MTRSTAATFWRTKPQSRRCARWDRESSTCSIAWAFPSAAREEGLLDFRRFGGTLFYRTAFAGATTGQQLLYALDEQVRRYESEGKITKYEYWEFLSAVIDSQRVCRGICAMDLRSMEVMTFPADAVLMATGGVGAIFGKSTNSVVCTGSAQGSLYQQGAAYAQRRNDSGASHLHPRRR